MDFKNYTLFLLSVFSIGNVAAQSFEWGGRFGGTGEDVVKSMHVDEQGNVYTTGYFTDTADFDITTAGNYELTASAWYDVFVQKVDNQGNLVWAKKFGGEGFDLGSAISTDVAGNVLITGVFENTVDFDPDGSGTTLTSNGGQDIFVLKLSPSGAFIWATSIGSEGYEEALAIDATSTGNPVLVGHFSETIDFNSGDGVFTMSSVGGNDTFILQLKDDGAFQSANRYGGSGIDIAMDLEITPNNDMYITGYFDETADLNPNLVIVSNFTSSASGFSGYIIHLNSSGELVYAGVTSGGNVQNNNIAVDLLGNTYVTGYFSGSANFNHTAGGSADFTKTSNEFYNGFVTKYNNAGVIQWVRHLQCDSTLFGFGIGVNSLGHVLSGGYFEGTANFGAPESPLSLTESSPNATEAFLNVLDNDGNFVNAFQFGGVDFIDTNTLGIDGADNVYHAAHFMLTVDINPLPGETLNVSAADFRDNYIVKIKPANLGFDDQRQINLTVYPNPASELIFLTADESYSGENYLIYDMLGKLVTSGKISENQSLSVGNLQSGEYFLKIGTANALKVLKE